MSGNPCIPYIKKKGKIKDHFESCHLLKCQSAQNANSRHEASWNLKLRSLINFFFFVIGTNIVYTPQYKSHYIRFVSVIVVVYVTTCCGVIVYFSAIEVALRGRVRSLVQMMMIRDDARITVLQHPFYI